jgi:glycosyltransferase involved in cell wall biosynthesis
MVAYTNYAFDARVRREAQTLASAGFDVVCLTTRNGSRPRRFVLNGVEVRELSVPKYQGKNAPAYVISYLAFLLASSAACARLRLAGKADVVHAHNIPDFLVFAGLLPRLTGSKIVLDVHDSVPETFCSKFSRSSTLRKALCLEEKLSAGIAHKVICVNEPQRQTLVDRGIPGWKTFNSMNVPDPAIFQYRTDSDKDRARDETAFNLIYHGTMADRLGVDLLIRASAMLRERIPPLNLHLWGRGDDLPKFRDLAKELGTESRVHFNPKGFDLLELPQHLRSMDVGVIGNRQNEATSLMLPVKLMEYVSLRIPAVAPRLRTIAHYFSDDMVAFYEPENLDSLAGTIHRLYRDPALRVRQASRAVEFLNRYGWEQQGPELVTFYRQLVGDR